MVPPRASPGSALPRMSPCLPGICQRPEAGIAEPVVRACGRAKLSRYGLLLPIQDRAPRQPWVRQRMRLQAEPREPDGPSYRPPPRSDSAVLRSSSRGAAPSGRGSPRRRRGPSGSRAARQVFYGSRRGLAREPRYRLVGSPHRASGSPSEPSPRATRSRGSSESGSVPPIRRSNRDRSDRRSIS